MLGHRLKQLREHQELSQEVVACELGIMPNSYSRYERGVRSPDCDTLKKIAAYFNVSADFLLGNDDVSICDVVELREFLCKGKYTIGEKFPTEAERQMLATIVDAIFNCKTEKS